MISTSGRLISCISVPKNAPLPIVVTLGKFTFNKALSANAWDEITSKIGILILANKSQPPKALLLNPSSTKFVNKENSPTVNKVLQELNARGYMVCTTGKSIVVNNKLESKASEPKMVTLPVSVNEISLLTPPLLSLFETARPL